MADDDKPKLVELQPRNEVRGSLEAVRRSMPEMLEYQKLLAKQRRAAFLALVEEGFTEQQALDLCWRT